MAVSAALARRISLHLDAGIQPSIVGRQVKLRDVVLIRANGTEAPAAEEVRRQAAVRNVDIDITFWDRNRAVQNQGNRSYAVDIAGNRHMIAQKRGQQRVVTAQGRRFYEEMPQTQWIIHLPVIHRRALANGTYSYFNPYTIDVTEEMMRTTFMDGSPEYALLDLTRTRDGADQEAQVRLMMTKWAELFPPGKVIPDAWEYDDDRVQVVVDGDREITFSAQYTGVTRTGERTIDTFLDQTVFGAPITSFDLWQKDKLHESSRRRNNKCGIDVIVASSSIRTAYHMDNGRPRFTAEEAAQRLMIMAKEHFPDSALAKCDAWSDTRTDIRQTRAAEVYMELRNRGAKLDQLSPYVAKMEAFLSKPKTLDEIIQALLKGNIYRKSKADTTLPKVSLSKALQEHVTWTNDLQHRVLTFLCSFPDHFVPVNDKFVVKGHHSELPPSAHYIEPDAAMKAIQEKRHTGTTPDEIL